MSQTNVKKIGINVASMLFVGENKNSKSRSITHRDNGLDNASVESPSGRPFPAVNRFMVEPNIILLHFGR